MPSQQTEARAAVSNRKERSIILACELVQMKKNPYFKEFHSIIDETAADIIQFGKTDNATKRGKRALVIKALQDYCAEVSEIAEETGLNKIEVKRVLKVLTRAKMLETGSREEYIGNDKWLEVTTYQLKG